MNLPPYRQVLECASPLALSDLVRGRKSGRGLPQSKTLARLRPPPRGSWSQCLRKSERRLSMNRKEQNIARPTVNSKLIGLGLFLISVLLPVVTVAQFTGGPPVINQQPQ